MWRTQMLLATNLTPLSSKDGEELALYFSHASQALCRPSASSRDEPRANSYDEPVNLPTPKPSKDGGDLVG